MGKQFIGLLAVFILGCSSALAASKELIVECRTKADGTQEFQVIDGKRKSGWLPGPPYEIKCMGGLVPPDAGRYINPADVYKPTKD